MSVLHGLVLLARPVQFLIFFFSGFLPRNPELWVFGAWGGNLMSGNSAAVFKYANNHPGARVRTVWISSSSELRKHLRSEGKAAFHPWSPQGVLACLRAGVYVYDTCGKDVNYWLSRKARNVLLRHGTGIKNIGRAINNPKHHLSRLYRGNLLERSLLRFLLPWHVTTYDLVIASSTQHAVQASEFFFVAKKNIVITGSPRNDILFGSMNSSARDPAAHWMRTCRESGRLVCLYMPTFRDNRTPVFPASWSKLDEICARQGVSVLIRLHPVDRSSSAVEGITQSRHLRLHDAREDPVLLFSDADCMITDYSSVVYDYMMLKNPVIFFQHDKAAFIANSRDFYFDLENVSPGPRPRDLDDLEAALRDLSAGRLAECPSGKRYQDTLARFHHFLDGGSSERVWTEMVQRYCPLGITETLSTISRSRVASRSLAHVLSTPSVQRKPN